MGGRQASRDRRGRPRRAEGRRSSRADRRHRRLPHRCVHAVRCRSGRPVPGHPRPRRRRHRAGSRPRRDQRQARRPRDSALHARVRRVRVLPIRQDQSLPGDPRDARQGPDAGRHLALLERRQADPALHGHQHVLRIHRGARDRARENQSEGAARQGLPARLRHHHRHRRGAQHGEGAARLDGRGLRPRRHRSGGRARRGDGQGRAHHRGRHEPVEMGNGQGAGRDRFRQSGRLRTRRSSRSSST